MISFRASEDGQSLMVRKVFDKHNHVVSKVGINFACYDVISTFITAFVPTPATTKEAQ